ncbi:MAG: V-type ATP synthase subunit E family protein [Candidatus Diapherotrites archaeon]
MSLEKVVDQIMQEAKNEAKQIESEAKKDAKEITSKVISVAKEKASKYNAETEQLLNETKRMELSSLKLQLSKNIITSKKTVMNSVRESALQKIDLLSKVDRKKLIQKLVNDAKQELPDAKHYYCNKKDKPLIKELFPKLTFKSEVEVLGGIILENNDGTVLVDKTFELVLDKVMEENLNELSIKLFG